MDFKNGVINIQVGPYLLQTLLIAATPDVAEFAVKILPQNLSMPSTTVLAIDALTKVRPPGIFIKKVLNITTNIEQHKKRILKRNLIYFTHRIHQPIRIRTFSIRSFGIGCWIW